MIHRLDAANQPLGRLASKIAVILRGKINPDYKPNVMPQEKVLITNIGKLKFTGKKLEQKTYHHYSGYPGGMKYKKLKILYEQNPKRVLWLAVYRMLASNRLRSRIMKNLEIK